MGGVQRTSHYDIGSRNIMAVRLWLMNHGLPIFKSQVGENTDESLIFLRILASVGEAVEPHGRKGEYAAHHAVSFSR
jgi:chemotaxis receptor (MCP) glutamine deamidase CheD